MTTVAKPLHEPSTRLISDLTARMAAARTAGPGSGCRSPRARAEDCIINPTSCQICTKCHCSSGLDVVSMGNSRTLVRMPQADPKNLTSDVSFRVRKACRRLTHRRAQQARIERPAMREVADGKCG